MQPDVKSTSVGSQWKWFVLIAVYTTNFIGSVTSFSAGILYSAIIERYGGDNVKATAVLSLNCGLLSILGPITTAVVNRFSCRASMVLGGVILTISGLLSGFVDSVDLLILTYGVLGGIGNSLTLVPANLILCFYFKDHRNLLIAILNGIIGLAFFLASPLTMFLLERYSLCGTFLIFGGLNAHICIAGIISRPSLLEKQAQDRRKTANLHLSLKSLNNSSWIRRKVSSFSVAFIFFILSTMCWNFVFSVCLVHLPTYALINGLSGDEVTLLMTCLSICNTIGRFLPALTATNRNIDLTVVHATTLCLLGAVTGTFPLYSSSLIGKYVFSACAGLLTGVPMSLMTPIAIDIVGLENISTAHGFAFFSCGVGIALGPPVAGLLYGSTGTYRTSFICVGIVSVIGSGLSLAGWCTTRLKARSEALTEDVLTTSVERQGEKLNGLLDPDQRDALNELKDRDQKHALNGLLDQDQKDMQCGLLNYKDDQSTI